MTLDNLALLFKEAGCRNLYAKVLAKNDNSKQQIYFGPGFSALSLFPNRGVTSDEKPGNETFKAQLSFSWIAVDGQLSRAPGAQLILYPQYPEVRFSGFLRGCWNGPNQLLTSREYGRILFLGVTRDESVIGFVASVGSDLANEFIKKYNEPDTGVFSEIALPVTADNRDARTGLLAELLRIHRLGWIDSKRLGGDGNILPCKSSNCGGYTLEAELGVIPNGRSEPDFLGFEVKQTAVPSFQRLQSGIITLMTPEPTGGLYQDTGTKAFLLKYGYPDKRGREDRINFGGNFKVGVRNENTGLTMHLLGYSQGKIYDKNGMVALVADDGEIAASWNFQGMMAHWARKHAHAAYIPSMLRKDPCQQYCYSRSVRLASKPDFLLVLGALDRGVIYYDPGIKLENATTQRSRIKKRSQFRIKSNDLGSIYGLCENIDVEN
jgi:MvaI/BcnI restriction endonuclease family